MKTLDLSAQDLDPEALKTQVDLLRTAAAKEGLEPLERLLVSAKTLEALQNAGKHEPTFMGFSIQAR
ncbi:hypothetical protein FXN63_09665 [Pigmentiphaga aceris]|uniref:Uncharacterized protein n=1 Tax=Pigmentiphaga aceris TaxID=1940612 RepID=A0A5C0AUI9_9BURK|nr:hypothetical protein [Pigmentiphaga aceris]QEI06072.1 hypothetical protein FXN63_09665 [Pigmentiphaga aceris]